MISSVLIANRGEIAVRIARTLRRLGIGSVGIYAAADAAAPHTELVDRAVALPSNGDASPYLNLEAIVELARSTGADAVHPGYGFLAENSEAARAVEAVGLIWIGPGPEAIELLGDKATSKETAIAAGVPVVPGLSEPAPRGGVGAQGAVDSGTDLERADAPAITAEAVAEFAAEHGFPVMIKAGAGGGGKGMRRIDEAGQIEAALDAARREAIAAFGSGHLLVEKLVEPARHIEVQVAVDANGTGLALGERECSLQRRHQKLIEESPSPVVGPELRAKLEKAAVDLALAAGYRNLGTVEFLADARNPENFYFLEMNARLQVEHPVTELVTGLDLVEMQLAIAQGESISRFGSGSVPLHGHSIEARICAERPAAGFLPAVGTVIRYEEPVEARVDSGIREGSEIGTGFDPMLMKVISHGADRDEAIEKLRAALGDLVLLGVETNTDFLTALLGTEQMQAGEITVTFAEQWTDGGGFTGPPGTGASKARQAAAAFAVLAATGADPSSGPAWPGEPQAFRPHAGFDTTDAWRLGGPGWGHWQFTDGEGETIDLAARLSRGGVEARPRPEADAIFIPVTGRGSETAEIFERPERWRAADDHGDLWLHGPAGTTVYRAPAPPGDQAAAGGGLIAELPGLVLAVKVAEGETVAQGQALMTVESMKMELEIAAPEDGVLAEISVAEGDHVTRGQVLAVVEAPETDQVSTEEVAV